MRYTYAYIGRPGVTADQVLDYLLDRALDLADGQVALESYRRDLRANAGVLLLRATDESAIHAFLTPVRPLILCGTVRPVEDDPSIQLAAGRVGLRAD